MVLFFGYLLNIKVKPEVKCQILQQNNLYFCLIAGVRPASVIDSQHQSCSAPICHSDHVSAEERKCLFSTCKYRGEYRGYKQGKTGGTIQN